MGRCGTLRRCGCAWTYERTKFLCVKFRLGSAGEPSRLYAATATPFRTWRYQLIIKYCLTHWGRVTHICVSDLTSIGSDNGLSPGRRQAIIITNAGILLIRHLGTSFSEFLATILIFSFKKMRLKVSSAKRRPFCLGLNVLKMLDTV